MSRLLFAMAAVVGLELARALPQDGGDCVTVSTYLPSTQINTYGPGTYYAQVTATTAEDAGTSTYVTWLPPTTVTVACFTATSTTCSASGTVTPTVTSTVYGGAASAAKRYGRMFARQDDGDACTTTVYTATSVVANIDTDLPPSTTTTQTRYNGYTYETTVTQTRTGTTTYALDVATATVGEVCGPTANVTSTPTVTATYAAACAPAAQTSAYDGFGLAYVDGPNWGKEYATAAADAPSCCQLCVDDNNCAASAWDSSGSGDCYLSFTVDYSSGQPNKDELAFQAYYDAGPNHPMAPGAGMWLASLGGYFGFANTKPDDGS